MSASKIKTQTAGSAAGAESSTVVLTVGHSNRTLDDFIRLLQAHTVSYIFDVRTVPRSRRNPQFDKTSLPRALKKIGLGYVHIAGLGGLRHAKRDSINMGWRNTSFRGYADYMQMPEFEQNLERLIRLAKKERIAIMCAEAVPWRCHRSLIADALLIRGIHLHGGTGIADAACHGAHVLAINQHRHSQGFDDLLDKSGNQMRGPLLILQSPREVPRDTRQLGQPQYPFFGNIGDGDAHQDRQQMVLTQPRLPGSLP